MMDVYIYDSVRRSHSPNRVVISAEIFGSCRLMFLLLTSAPICPLPSCESAKNPGKYAAIIISAIYVADLVLSENGIIISGRIVRAADKRNQTHFLFVGPR